MNISFVIKPIMIHGTGINPDMPVFVNNGGEEQAGRNPPAESVRHNLDDAEAGSGRIIASV